MIFEILAILVILTLIAALTPGLIAWIPWIGLPLAALGHGIQWLAGLINLVVPA